MPNASNDWLAMNFLLAFFNDTCFGFIIHMCLIFVQSIITKYQICAVTGFLTMHVR